MNGKKLIRSFLVSLMLVMGLSACVYDPHYYGPPAHRYYPYYYPYYYDYYFYPSARVYFQFSTGFYYYYYRDRWIRTKVLPPHIHVNPWERVTIRVDSDKPYLNYREHVKKYPPKPRPPGYREPPAAKPAPGSVWDRTRQQPPSRPAPPDVQRPGTKPAPDSVWERAKPPTSRPAPPSRERPGDKQFERRESPVPNQEREHHERIFREHQQKQKEYEKEWEKRNKVYRR